MLTLNFFETFARELLNFFKDTKELFTELLSNIHNFLNRFMSDDVLIVFGIAIAAFLAIILFRAVINKR